MVSKSDDVLFPTISHRTMSCDVYTRRVHFHIYCTCSKGCYIFGDHLILSTHFAVEPILEATEELLVLRLFDSSSTAKSVILESVNLSLRYLYIKVLL